MSLEYYVSPGLTVALPFGTGLQIWSIAQSIHPRNMPKSAESKKEAYVTD